VPRKVWSVLTTARRTLGIVCRKKGKRTGASSDSDNLGILMVSYRWDALAQIMTDDSFGSLNIDVTLSYVTSWPGVMHSVDLTLPGGC
jgi:hypothetical protein